MLMTQSTARDATTAAVAQSTRCQPYRFIHKALRLMMARTLLQVASLDATRADERAAMHDAVEELLRVCTTHLAHENRFFHAPLRERAPRAVLPFDDDHEGHERAIAALRERLQLLADGADRARQHAYALYLELSRFVGENLEHMADEETQLTQALWQHFSDAEIHGLEDALRATFTPETEVFYLRWMARALDDAELAELAGGARQAMPAEAFGPFAETILDELTAPRRARLARALGLPPVPGLVTA